MLCFAKRTLRDVNDDSLEHRQPDHESQAASSESGQVAGQRSIDDNLLVSASSLLIPAFAPVGALTETALRCRFADACTAWLMKSPSVETRTAYSRELNQFLRF